MRIFITGGAGFIGTEILKRLASVSHELLLLSRDEAESKLLRRYSRNIIVSDLKDIQKAKKGDRVGIKVAERCHKGYRVYKV